MNIQNTQELSKTGYRIAIEPVEGAFEASFANGLSVQSDAVRLLHETRLATTVYFPLECLDESLLEASNLRTFCPFKGTARYWHIGTGENKIENAIWAYDSPLKEALEVKGHFSIMPHALAGLQSKPDVNLRPQDGHISSPLADWILREAAYCKDRAELVGLLGRKFVGEGIALQRLTVTIWSLHPEIAGLNMIWLRDEDTVRASEPDHSLFSNPAYINSPLRHVTDGLGGVRQPLNEDKTEFDFPIMADLKAKGATDYVAMPLIFSDGQINIMTLTSDHPDGFTTANLGLIFECSSVISRYLEVMTLRKNTEVLLETYLGQRTGRKVLNGAIRRGEGEDIKSVVLFSDLRNSTTLAETLPQADYLDLINDYFDTISDAITAHGGEVLKFIGDAVLAVFPISDEPGDQENKAREALKTARLATQSVQERANARLEEGRPAFEAGIALHVGDVAYGNVGARDRLDFTVVGPAVNLASRIEGLTKETGHKVLASGAFRQALGAGEIGLTSAGSHAFKGITGEHEIFVVDV
ncbi:MAG: DUF427 domain-containing protein [Pseudomonadota bacterium]